MGVRALSSSALAQPAPVPARAEPPSRGVLLRIRARLLSPRLDAALAHDEEQPDDALLAARSRQLVACRERERLACSVQRLHADRSRRAGFSTAIPVDATALRIATPALAQLAQALRHRATVAPRGVALTRLLLTDPASPLYRPQRDAAVYEAAREALLAL